jgi:hypothetical protein
MKKIILTYIITILVMLSLSCSKKDNIIGYNGNIEVIDTTLTHPINFIRTFKDSLNNYPENSKLIVGKFKNAEVRSLLKFKNLPDTSWIDTVNINSCEIIIKKKALFNNIDFNINVYQVTKDWKENSVTSDSLWNNYDSLLADFTTFQDTITFSIDTILVREWIESDSTNPNYGIMLKSEGIENNFVEFYSSEKLDYCPYLRIVYDDLSKTDTIKCKVSEDTYIGFDENFSINGDSLSYPMIGNIYPTRTIINFPDYDSLSHLLNLSTEELRKITINKAEITSFIDTSFVSDDYLGIKPYYILDTIYVVPNIESEYIYGSVIPKFYSDNDSLKINITGIIQGFTRENLKNHQILLKSTSENKDFSYIKFSEDLNPHLRIVYTKPVLED